MEPFTSLLITRNLERAPLIILTFVQRALLVREHYLQVPRAQVEDVTEQHPACVLVAIVVSVFTKVTVHQVRILIVGVVNGISALLRRQLPRIDVALAVDGVDLVAVRCRGLRSSLCALDLRAMTSKCAAAWHAYLLHIVCRVYLRMLSSASQ